MSETLTVPTVLNSTKARKSVMVSVSKLKPAKHNPPGRVHGKMLAFLTRSIAEIGLIYPILITKDYHVIEGHRRLAAAKRLGWTKIPAFILVGDLNADTVYAQINATSLKLTGNQNLQVYLHNPNAVTDKARRNFDRVQERFGTPILKEIVSKGMSINILHVAGRVAAFLDVEDLKETKQIAKWLIMYRNSRMVLAYIEMRQPARQLLMSIRNNKPLKATFTAG